MLICVGGVEQAFLLGLCLDEIFLFGFGLYLQEHFQIFAQFLIVLEIIANQ
jgi:hypothetical protein